MGKCHGREDLACEFSYILSVFGSGMSIANFGDDLAMLDIRLFGLFDIRCS